MLITQQCGLWNLQLNVAYVQPHRARHFPLNWKTSNNLFRHPNSCMAFKQTGEQSAFDCLFNWYAAWCQLFRASIAHSFFVCMKIFFHRNNNIIIISISISNVRYNHHLFTCTGKKLVALAAKTKTGTTISILAMALNVHNVHGREMSAFPQFFATFFLTPYIFCFV